MTNNIKMIVVKNSKGATVTVYTPNFIGRPQHILLEEAQKKADSLDGSVEVSYWK